MGPLKNEASASFVASVNAVEERADTCFQQLRLLALPRDFAIWALLTAAIGKVEDEIAERGDTTPQFTALLINLSHICTVAIGWVNEHGKPGSKLRKARHWNSRLGLAAEEAIAVTHNYCSFLSCFPMWHKNRYSADLIAPSLVRFTVGGGARQRQVSAHLKGFRPKEGKHKGVVGKKVEQSKAL